jgi:MSHA biogenesis protein MshJ
MKRLRERIRNLSGRFDAMSLRERAMIFGAAALVTVVLVNAFLLDPLLARQNSLGLQLAQAQDRQRAIQEAAQELAQRRGRDPGAELQARLEALRREEAALEEGLRDSARRLVPPEEVPALLQDILSRHRPLELVALRSLAPAPLAGGAPGITRAAPSGSMVFRHGVEVVVRGGYLDMLQYLAELERLPWRLHWGEVSLSAEAYPTAQLSFALYTLSLDKSWLRI